MPQLAEAVCDENEGRQKKSSTHRPAAQSTNHDFNAEKVAELTEQVCRQQARIVELDRVGEGLPTYAHAQNICLAERLCHWLFGWVDGLEEWVVGWGGRGLIDCLIEFRV